MKWDPVPGESGLVYRPAGPGVLASPGSPLASTSNYAVSSWWEAKRRVQRVDPVRGGRSLTSPGIWRTSPRRSPTPTPSTRWWPRPPNTPATAAELMRASEAPSRPRPRRKPRPDRNSHHAHIRRLRVGHHPSGPETSGSPRVGSSLVWPPTWWRPDPCRGPDPVPSSCTPTPRSPSLSDSPRRGRLRWPLGWDVPATGPARATAAWWWADAATHGPLPVRGSRSSSVSKALPYNDTARSPGSVAQAVQGSVYPDGRWRPEVLRGLRHPT